MTWAYQDSNKSSQVIGIYPYSNYHSQDLGISNKTRSQDLVCHRVLVRYIIHLYCLAVQAGFYNDVLRVHDFRSKGPGFNPRPGHGDFLRIR